MKKANTGIDPEGTFEHFIKGDVVSNIDVHRGGQRAMTAALGEARRSLSAFRSLTVNEDSSKAKG